MIVPPPKKVSYCARRRILIVVDITCCTSHGVEYLILAIICSRNRGHFAGIISDNDNLTSSWVHRVVENATKGLGRQPSAVNHDIGLLARVVSISSLRDVLDYCSLEDGTVFHTLANKPWKIDCCINAD